MGPVLPLPNRLPPELVWRVPLVPAPHPSQVVAAVDELSIAWRGDWEPEPLVHVLDAATGAELGRVVCATLGLTSTATGFIALDVGYRRSAGRRDRDEPCRLVALDRNEDAIAVTALDVDPDASLVGADAQADRFVLFRNGRCELRRWGESQPLAIWDLYMTGVDWDAGCIWGSPTGSEVVVAALDGSWGRRLDEAWPYGRVSSAGGGVLRLGLHGVRLFKPQGRVLTVLPATSRTLWSVSVSGDARTARVVLGWKPRAFGIDLDGGRIVDAPGDALHLARASSSYGALWHPRRELVALKGARRRIDVRTTDGALVSRLSEGGTPKAWLAGDDSLIVVAGEGRSSRMERWRIGVPGEPERETST